MLVWTFPADVFPELPRKRGEKKIHLCVLDTRVPFTISTSVQYVLVFMSFQVTFFQLEGIYRWNIQKVQIKKRKFILGRDCFVMTVKNNHVLLNSIEIVSY